MSHYPNPHQPKRPSVCPDDGITELQFRTHVSRPTSRLKIYDIRNVMAQTLLYRWARNEFVNHVAQTDLRDYIFFNHNNVTQTVMGRVINEALRYDPRILKGKSKSNPQAKWIISLHSRWDLIYGLEWMMSFWLRKLDPDMDLNTLFDEIGACEETTLGEMYWDPIVELSLWKQEPSWKNFWRDYKLKEQKPLLSERRAPVERPILKPLL